MQNDEKNQIIPRPIGRIKAQIIARFDLGWIDIGVALVTIIIFIIFALLLGNVWWVSLIISIIGVIFGVLLLIGQPNRRVYNLILMFVIFLVARKKYVKKNVNQLIPYHKVYKKELRHKDGSYFGIIKIYGSKIDNLREDVAWNKVLGLSNILRDTDSKLNIFKLENHFEIDSQTKNFKKILRGEKNPYKKKIIKHNLEIVNYIGDDRNFFPSYFISLHAKNKANLNGSISQLQNKLAHVNLNSVRLTKHKLVDVAVKSIVPTMESRKDLDIDWDKKEGYKFKRFINLKSANIKPSHIQLNNNLFTRVLAIDQYPVRSNLCWLADLFNIEKTSVFLINRSVSQQEAIRKIDKAYEELRMRSIGTNFNKLSKTSNQYIYINSMEEFSDAVHSNGEILKHNNLFILVYGKNLAELNRVTQEVKSSLGRGRMKLHNMLFLQLQGWLTMHSSNISSMKNALGLEIGTLALAHSWPFISESFRDNEGDYIGYTETGQPTFLDWSYRDSDANRNQSNSIVFGATGNGKSTFIKKIIKDEFARGHKVFVIDPENEYENLANNLGGTYLDLSGFSSDRPQRINPLQPFNSENEDGTVGVNSFDQHFKFIETFFSNLIYPGRVDTVKEMNYLKFALKSLYSAKKIVLNTNQKIENSDWPTISDLYKHIQDIVANKVSLDDSTWKDLGVFEELLERIFDLTNKGSDGTMWDGHTTIDADNENLIIFNIQRLYSGGNLRLINAQMYLILKYLEHLVVENKAKANLTKKIQNVSITVDEAHLLINKDNPSTLFFAYNMYKRIRKYYGWIRFVTQNISDFTATESIKRETSGIINSIQFMFVFGLKEADIQDLDDLLKQSGGLTPYEKGFLNRQETHTAIFISGSNYRSILNMDYSEKEWDLWKTY